MTRVLLQSDIPCDDPDCAGVCNANVFMGGSCWHDRCTCHLAGSARHWGDPCDLDSCVGVCTNHGFDGGDCWYERCACTFNGAAVRYRCSAAVNAFLTFAASTLFLPF
ncbi:hypothetical protein AXF42_Ash001704 [Apostasia shenzhenica]|uniref:Uncharacterized protein n=1 Tax=Apostasia shenzhenica TaxID=1088818 RepID=A0A2I0AAZ2_9ASPA|nr:hypothetical protein AXF42_Ash001704 [Apostasia shenzhenica]